MVPSMWRKIHVKAKFNNEADSIVQVPGEVMLGKGIRELPFLMPEPAEKPPLHEVKLYTFERIMMLKLRGGTAAFQIKVGRYHVVEREERVCKECDSGEGKNVWHSLLQWSAWEHLRQPC